MSEAKKPRLEHPVQEFIARRWSPVGFDGRAVDRATLLSIFEAARWAPSAFNEQPWRYILASREDPAKFERMLSCLVEGNRAWAHRAGALALGLVSMNFARNGKANSYARHDLGLASAQLSAEASARGVQVHQMAGIIPERARELFGVPEDFEAVTGLALGYPGEAPEEDLRARDAAPRSRRPLSQTLFTGSWGRPFEEA